jgi:hypothetical protein
VGDDARAELQRLWDEHRARPFPSSQWSDLVERFGPDDSGADLVLHDADVAETSRRFWVARVRGLTCSMAQTGRHS